MKAPTPWDDADAPGNARHVTHLADKTEMQKMEIIRN
jgi:hypothetical protein